MVWAPGLLAETTEITVLATVHAAFYHPVVVAKQMVTVDNIGRGRGVEQARIRHFWARMAATPG
jgi:alkanesulfonate monooxygenase SsuD/methylene tetrahydromethanopterin reductase-like flavin-dependent oxidoreductase (luciferase family)